MTRRDGLNIKKKILQVLKENGEMSLGEIERKTNTNNLTIISHLRELEFFGFVEIIKHNKNQKTGRPSTSAKLKNKN
jgi:predicted ArsR family transcriptional regulator